jgi:hypothetical protein
MTDVEALEMTYLDLFSLFRKEKVKNEDTGITETVEVEIYSNKKCALSKNNLTNIMQSDGVGNLSESYTFFTNPMLEIKPGDKLVIKSLSGTDSFLVSSKPFKYNSHQELILSYKDRV